jgi:hypothetical protein
MAQYFMHLRGENHKQLDSKGREFPSLMALRNAVLFRARDLLSGEDCTGAALHLDPRSRIDAEDASGSVVHTLSFKHAATFIPEIVRTPVVRPA